MKKILVFLAAILSLWGCGSSKITQEKITKSAWISASPAVVDEVEGTVMMTLLFSSDKDVRAMVSVQSKDDLLVKPYEFARGTYSFEKDSKEGDKIALSLKDIEGKDLKLKGKFEKGAALVLISDDGVTRLFGKIKDYKFE